MGNTKIDHDRLFKELLQTFFAEFMELFFPKAAREIDLTQITFLQQETFTDVIEGDKHIVDLLVRTKLKGEPGLILIHLEHQAYRQKDFNERMFIYFSRLYQEHRCPILPIAVFSYDQIREEPDTFQIIFPFLNVLNFQFYKLELRKLNWRDYIRKDNPVAAALLSKMGFLPDEKVKVKLEFLRSLARMKLDPARTELLGGFFESYLKLTQAEEEQLSQELKLIDREEAELIMEITTSWHEKGRAEGILIGRQEGISIGRKEGISIGEKKGKLEVAKNLLKLGIPIEQIVIATELTETEIKKLAEEVNEPKK